MANIADDRLLGRYDEGDSGPPIALTASSVRALLNVADGATANTGDITGVTITTDSGGGSAASDTGGSADFSILGSNGVGVTNSGTTITAVAVPGEIDHDSLNNFVANEHIDWTASSAGTIHSTNYSNTNQLTTFVVEDGDGTEVTISQDKEWKFVEGTGIDINWTDTSNGSDADPYDLTITCDLEGTELKSTGETGGTKFLREDGDGTCSWQTVSGGASALNDLSDVTYSSGDLTITSLDKIIASTALTIQTTDSGGHASDLTFDIDGDAIFDMNSNLNNRIKFQFGQAGADLFQIKADASFNAIEMGGEDGNYSLIKLLGEGGSSANDYFQIFVEAQGVTEISTVDSSGANGILSINPDGQLRFEKPPRVKEQASADADQASYG
jgi:hypothetical protein